MKKALLFVSLMGLFGVGYTQGIPVYDNANVVTQKQNFVQQIAEMAEQLRVAEAQLSSFKDEAINMKRRLEGYSGIIDDLQKEDLINSLNILITSVDTDSIEEYFKRNNLSNIEDERIKGRLEREATNYNIYDKFSSQLTDLYKDLEKLEGRFSNSKTPQEREELSNAIALQMAKIDTINKIAEYELKKIDNENKLKDDMEYYEYINSFFGELE